MKPGLPDEWLECYFILKDGEEFKVDYEYVEVGGVDSANDYREDTVKGWSFSLNDHERVITEEEVLSVMVVVKEQYRDKAHSLPRPDNPAPSKDE